MGVKEVPIVVVDRDLDDTPACAQNLDHHFRKDLDASSPAVSKAIEKLAGGQNKGLRTIEQRMEREIAEKNKSQTGQWQKTETWLRPNKKPQERVFSVLAPLLINYGMNTVDRLIENLDRVRTDPENFVVARPALQTHR